MFAGIYFSRCEFSVLRRPIAAKFCSVIERVFDFIIFIMIIIIVIIIIIMMLAAKALTVKCESAKSA